MSTSAAAFAARPLDSVHILPSRTRPQPHVADNRRLSDTPDLEVENAFKIDSRLRDRVEGYFKKCGIEQDGSIANSLYHDGHELDLVTNGFTLRDRVGGCSLNGTYYNDVFGLKYRHAELQAAADEIVSRLHSCKKLSAFTPYVRAEVERKHRYPRYASELRVRDLPKDIRKIVVGRIGEKAARRIVLKPTIDTLVQRRKYEIYLDPDQFTAAGGGPFGSLKLEELTLLPEPSERMKQSGRYVCLELSIDQLRYRQPRRGAFMSDILGDMGDHRQKICRRLKDTEVMEYEYKPGQSGAALTDEALVATYAGFGLALNNLDKELAIQVRGEQTRKSSRRGAANKKPYKPIRSTQSKAVGGFDIIAQRRRGRVRKAYEQARVYAP